VPAQAPSPRTSKRRLCVIVPHRPRNGASFNEPERFAAYMSVWLPVVANVFDFALYVVEQEDEYRFNRGWLMNIGIVISRAVEGCSIFALHDVDLLPVDARLPYGSYGHTEEGLVKAKGHQSKELLSPVHLSPPGVHPEYVFPSFKGGAWLFEWNTLLQVNGYAHVYWGWGQEDDDLGARMKDTNVTAVKFSPKELFPKASVDLKTQCTGYANECAEDPSLIDCFGHLPYSEFKQLAFRDVPAHKNHGLQLKKSRSAVAGTCFVHAHEGKYSRDELGKQLTGSDGEIVTNVEPDSSFKQGRSWNDVKAGKFRADTTTGLSGLLPLGIETHENPEKPRNAQFTNPVAHHGFALLSMEVVQVEVKRGVASMSHVTPHPHPSVTSTLNPELNFETNTRWSGNAFVGDAFANAKKNAKMNKIQSTSSKPTFVRLRVRLTCDEDETPWCV